MGKRATFPLNLTLGSGGEPRGAGLAELFGRFLFWKSCAEKNSTKHYCEKRKIKSLVLKNSNYQLAQKMGKGEGQEWRKNESLLGRQLASSEGHFPEHFAEEDRVVTGWNSIGSQAVFKLISELCGPTTDFPMKQRVWAPPTPQL